MNTCKTSRTPISASLPPHPTLTRRSFGRPAACERLVLTLCVLQTWLVCAPLHTPSTAKVQRSVEFQPRALTLADRSLHTSGIVWTYPRPLSYEGMNRRCVFHRPVDLSYLLRTPDTL
jgi:hypothetical protein